MNSNSDDILIKRILLIEDKKAFSSLVIKYQGGLRAFFRHLTSGDVALSDDLSQETFIRIYTHLHKFAGTAAFSTWMYRVAYRIYLDHLRSASNRQGRLSQPIELTIPHIERDSHEGEIGAGMDLYKALQILNPTEKACLTLQYVKGFEIKEIAHIIQLPEGTVKSHVHRAKNKLKQYLINNGYERRK